MGAVGCDNLAAKRKIRDVLGQNHIDRPYPPMDLYPFAIQRYLKMHRYPEARAAFQAIVAGFAASALIVPARRYLDLMSSQGV